MSVVGVDFGTLNTVIAVARNRGVDVITNEVCLMGKFPRREEAMLTRAFAQVSNRATPYVLYEFHNDILT